MPDSPRADPLQTKAELKAGGTFVTVCLTKGKKLCTAAVGDRKDNPWEKQPCRHQDHGRRGGKRCSRCQAEIPLQPMESLHWSRFSGRSCGLWKTHTGFLDEII